MFTIFVVIVITNGFNLIDGVDGLAAGIGVIAASCFGFVAIMMEQNDLAFISFSLAGALLAFLRYNFNPAKIFMGDTGSLVVGMILSVLARIMKGHHPLYPGRGHIHHALLDLGFGHKRTALILYLISILLILGSYFLLELNVNLSIAILALVSYFLLLIPFYILRKRK